MIGSFQWPAVRPFQVDNVSTGSPVIKAALEDLSAMKWKASRQRMAREIQLVAGYAMADPNIMFDPSLHDLALMNAGEPESDYAMRPKFARALTSRVLDSRKAGLASLPLNLRASTAEEFDFEPHMRNLDLDRLQDLTEISATVAARPWWDPFEMEIRYKLYPSALFYPYLDESGDVLLGMVAIDVGPAGIRVEVWSQRDYTVITERGDIAEVRENPYGEVPFAIFRVREHPWNWWGVSEIAWVALNNLAVNKSWSDLLQLAKEQAFGWYLFIRPKQDDPPFPNEGGGFDIREADKEGPEEHPPSEPKITGGTRITVDQGGDVKSITPDAQIKAIADTISDMGAMTLDDAYVFQTRGDKVIPDSGFGSLVQTTPYLRKMRLVRKAFGEGLSRLVELAEMVRFAGMNPQIPAVRRVREFRVTPEWDESPLLLKPQREANERDQFDIDAEIVSPVDILMRRQGIKDRKAAKDILRRVQEEKAEFGGGAPGPSATQTEEEEARAESQAMSQ